MALPFYLQAESLLLEVRAGKYYPSSELLREIYHRGGGEFEVEGTMRIFGSYAVFANYSSFKKSGHDASLGKTTTVNINPISLGLKYHLLFSSCYSIYLGIGLSSTMINSNDTALFSTEHFNKNNFGGVGKSGILLFSGRYFADFFADYHYSKVSAEHHTQNIGGLRTGIGLGLRF